MYLHVPAAMWSMGLYTAMAVAAFVGVVWQIKMADSAIAARRRWGRSAPGGAGQRRGMGQADVGGRWIWDARLTSELVLLFLYAGVIALWHAFDDRRLAGRAAGILVLVGVVNLPIIHYSVYWWNTLHRGSTNLQQTIDPSMRLPLRICIFAFLTLSVTLTLMRLRNLILQLERRRPWVVALVNKGAADEPRLFVFRRLPEYGRLCRVRLAGGGRGRRRLWPADGAYPVGAAGAVP